MKQPFTALSFGCLAALMFTSCSSDIPPAPADWNSRYMQYIPLSRSERGKLKRALTDCAALELERNNFVSDEPHWRCSLTRGAGLEPILASLAAVPHWYVADYGDSTPLVNPMCSDDIRFLDAEGKEIYSPDTLIFEPCCPTPEGKRRQLSDFLPFPEFKNPFECE